MTCIYRKESLHKKVTIDPKIFPLWNQMPMRQSRSALPNSLAAFYTIGYQEDWPVFLGADRLSAYQGQNINYRDHAGNNRDSVGSNFLYNKNLLQLCGLDMCLDRMNIYIPANNKELLDIFALISSR